MAHISLRVTYLLCTENKLPKSGSGKHACVEGCGYSLLTSSSAHLLHFFPLFSHPQMKMLAIKHGLEKDTGQYSRGVMKAQSKQAWL